MRDWKAWAILIVVNLSITAIAAGIMRVSIPAGWAFILLVGCPTLLVVMTKMRARLLGKDAMDGRE